MRIEFIGYQQTLDEPIALFNVSQDDGSAGTTLAKQTLIKRGLPVPDHPDYASWITERQPVNGTIDIEALLARLKARLDLIERQLVRKRDRMMELKSVVREARELKGDIGRLKRDKKSLEAKRDWLISICRELHGGTFPDGMYPLFGSQDAEAH